MTAEFIVAVHAIVFLNHRKEYMSSEKIAENVCTNPARIRKVMAELKKANLVEAKASFVGGYAFHKDPQTVTLYDIFQATSKQIVKVSWRSGDHSADCPISQKMEGIMNQVFSEVESSAKEVLQKITIGDIDEEIFPKTNENSTKER